MSVNIIRATNTLGNHGRASVGVCMLQINTIQSIMSKHILFISTDDRKSL